MIRNGIVSASQAACAEPPSTQNTANILVEIEPQAACGSCQSAGGCGVTLLRDEPAALMLQCRNLTGLSVNPGDTVQVQLREPGGAWLTLVGWAYGLPTLGMLLGAYLGHFLADEFAHQFAQVMPTGMPQEWAISALSDGLPVLGFAIGLAGGLFAWNSIAKSTTTRNRSGSEAGDIVGIIMASSN